MMAMNTTELKTFQPIMYKSQVVAGMNYAIKVSTSIVP